MLEVDSLSVRYPDGTRALDEVSLVVPRGQFCVVLGSSGAGKSTLMKVINGLQQPSGGAVRIAGVERWPQPRARGFPVATIHQGIDLVMRSSVLDNVLHGALSELGAFRSLMGHFGIARRRRACELLHRVGLTEAQLYRRAAELSGGQQQRVGVARAFMKDPQLVLADEPVASLDPRTSREILALLRESAREKQVSVLCSLHDVTLAREFADRIVAMRAGRVVLDCVPKDFDSADVESLYSAAA
jgi:phosphonate transport system ATP-binding protein